MAVRRRWWVAPLLIIGLFIGLGWREEPTGAETDSCVALARAQPVRVGVRDPNGPAAAASTQTGYLAPEGEVLIPLRGLIEPFVKGPLGIYWDGTAHTLSLLGPTDVLSVHFPAGKSVSERAILNGEAVPMRAVACGDQFYLSGSHLASLLQLEISADGEGAIWLAPR